MKAAILFLAVTLAAFAYVASEPSNAQKQHDINYLLWKVNEELRDDHLKHLSETFKPAEHASHYDDGGAAVQHLMEEDKDHRLLEQKHWFSLFNTKQREEAIMLFEVLIHCKDWDTFVGNAAYWRNHMNEGEFVYALYVAVLHSPLTEHIVLPPLYEVTPHMFTNSEVIQQAYHAKMTQTPGKFKSTFTGTSKNKEQRVAYFGEDIGMNTHHVFWHMEFPFWWKDSYGHKLDRKGENFYWVHNQLNHRFDHERISNYLSPTEELNWHMPIYEGFAPHTTYKYGGQFPSRPDDIEWSDVDGVARVRDMIIYDNRIRDAIAHGYIEKDDGTHVDIMNDHGADVLGDIIESSNYSPNVHYYGALHNTAHIMLGRQADPHGKYDLPPGVMEHFETATRDPAFFRLHKYMDNIFRDHKDSLPAYTTEDLTFDGITVTEFSVEGDLETYMEDFEYSLVNAVDDTPEIADVEISTIIPRLNHKEFSYHIAINNNNGVDKLATVRIFGWAHRDENGELFSFDEGRWAALELDKFWVQLHAGGNEFVRKSSEASVTVADVPSFKTIMDRTEAARNGGGDLDLHEFESATGMPNRFLIPKGQKNGMEFDIIICVTDGEADAAVDNLHENTDFIHYGAHGVYPDKRPHGYPLDRRYDDARVFHEVPNFEHTMVKIFHTGHHH